MAIQYGICPYYDKDDNRCNISKVLQGSNNYNCLGDGYYWESCPNYKGCNDEERLKYLFRR